MLVVTTFGPHFSRCGSKFFLFWSSSSLTVSFTISLSECSIPNQTLEVLDTCVLKLLADIRLGSFAQSPYAKAEDDVLNL